MPASGAQQNRRVGGTPGVTRPGAPPLSPPCSSSDRSASADGDDDDDSLSNVSDTASCSSSSSSSSSDDSSTPVSLQAAKERKKAKKQRFYKRVLPNFIYMHGRTVHGGNPIVQQTLPGVFAYASPFVMIPVFFVFMIPFLVVGAVVLVRSRSIYLVDVEYSHIHKYQYVPTDPAVNINQGIRSFTAEGVTHRQGTSTWVEFDVTKRMQAPVYMYYKINNLYQNHRDFHNGRLIKQLKGDKKIGSTFLCKPFVEPGYLGDVGKDVVVSLNGRTKRASDFVYNPCGLAAWATFNDTLTLYKVASAEKAGAGEVIMGGKDGTLPLTLVCNGTDFDPVGNPRGASVQPNLCTKKGISWRADTKVRFRELVTSADSWSLRFPYPTDNDYLNNGWYLNEPGHSLQDPMDLDFQVWMKSAVLPNFRKLYREINVDLEPGRYALHVNEFFDVVSFQGSKHLVLRTGNWIGDSNITMGVVYIVIGCLSFVMGVAFGIEFCLRREGHSRIDTSREPKRSWYHFDPRNPLFEQYYKRRLERHVPMPELIALRKLQDGVGGEDDEDESGAMVR